MENEEKENTENENQENSTNANESSAELKRADDEHSEDSDDSLLPALSLRVSESEDECSTQNSFGYSSKTNDTNKDDDELRSSNEFSNSFNEQSKINKSVEKNLDITIYDFGFDKNRDDKISMPSDLDLTKHIKNIEDLNDSDSDLDNTIKKKVFKRKTILDSSDDDDANENGINDKMQENSPSIKLFSSQSPQKQNDRNINHKVPKPFKYSSIVDSESDSNESNVSKTLENENNYDIKYNNENVMNEKVDSALKFSSIVDSESDSNESNVSKISENENNFDTKYNKGNLKDEKNSSPKTKTKNKTKSPKKQRTAAKTALDTINQIKSETQRMHREQELNMPYHKPKNYSLKEFMNRKTIRQRNLQKEKFSLKMDSEELEKFGKYLKERELESQTMFISDDDETEGKSSKDVAKRNTDNIPDKEKSFMINEQVEEKIENENFENVDEDYTNMNNMDDGIIENSNQIENEDLENILDLQIEKSTEYLNDLNELEKNQKHFFKPNHDDSLNLIDASDNLKSLDGIVLITDKSESLENSSSFKPQNTEVSPKSSKIQILSNVIISPAIVKPISSIKILKQLIIEDKELQSSPTLKGDSNSIIDLETGEILSSNIKSKNGINKLFEKFLLTNQSLSKSPVINSSQKDSKPGACYTELKNSLKKIISEKRISELGKKLKHFEEESEIVSKICAEEDDDEDFVPNEEDELDEEHSSIHEQDDDDEDDNQNLSDNQDEFNDGNNTENNCLGNSDEENDIKDDELEFNDVEDGIDDADDELDAFVNRSSKKKTKKKSRLLKTYESESDDDEMTQSLNRLNNIILRLSDDESENKNNPIEKLCDDDLQKIKVNDDELLELCSGTFDQTQFRTQKTEAFVIPTTQARTQFDENELANLCSGKFSDKEAEVSPEKIILGTSDEENVITTKKVQKLSKKNKIHYSDDENIEPIEESLSKSESEKVEDIEETELEDEEILSDDNQSLLENEDKTDTFVDYDSEENEVTVKMTKKQRVQRANEFVENEAALTESEWGSADEDEKNLDYYDIELGDEAEFDQDKLRDEVGKIHMRKMMDQDAKELKKIQDLIFEDEENDGIGRERKFRWKITENGFDLVNPTEQTELVEGEEEDDEEQWRKMKYEREQILEENQNLPQLKATTVSLIQQKKISLTKNIKLITNTRKDEDSPFLISKSTNNGNRGSFLRRDQDTLSKVANIISHIPEFDGGIGTVHKSVKNSRSFVFTTLSQKPIDTMATKRKLTEDSENENIDLKKKKFSDNSKNNLINFSW